MFSLVFFIFLTLCGQQDGESGRATQGSLVQKDYSGLPTAQEELLAELLAELPENRRAAMIARALANSRYEHQSGTDKSSLEKSSSELQSALGALRSQQQALVRELAELRRESQLLEEKLDQLALLPRREPTIPPQALSRTFVLPNYQRPGSPVFSGPYVNQPSGPMIPLQPAPEPESEQAITLELAQLSRDMFRLNQRLQKLQGNSETSKGPMVLNLPSKESAEQAKRPSPLLPR